MTASTYTVATAEGTIATRSAKASAIKLADESRGALEVTVSTAAGTVVHTVPATTTRFKPWTRTESPKFEAPSLAGFTPAYQRVRVNAVVYRANDKSGWLVLQTTTGARFEAGNTAEARDITNAMAEYRRKEQAETAEKAKAAKELVEA